MARAGSFIPLRRVPPRALPAGPQKEGRLLTLSDMIKRPAGDFWLDKYDPKTHTYYHQTAAEFKKDLA